MVCQRDALLEWRNIRKNILLPVEFAKKRPADYTETVAQLLDLVGLSDFGHSYPRALSGGMRKRAAICRALVDRKSDGSGKGVAVRLDLEGSSIIEKKKKNIHKT